MAEYPSLDPKNLVPLRLIAQEAADDPGYLDRPECPYSPELKAFLAVFSSAKPQNGGFLGQNGSKWATLEAESAELYQQLKEFRAGMNVEDVSEQMSYFRTSTSLLDKLITVQERAVGLKQIHEFQETVLEVIETVLTVGQRTEVMQKLRASIDGGEMPAEQEKS